MDMRLVIYMCRRIQIDGLVDSEKERDRERERENFLEGGVCASSTQPLGTFQADVWQ